MDIFLPHSTMTVTPGRWQRALVIPNILQIPGAHWSSECNHAATTLTGVSPSSKCWWPGSKRGWTSDVGLGCMRLQTGQSLQYLRQHSYIWGEVRCDLLCHFPVIIILRSHPHRFTRAHRRLLSIPPPFPYQNNCRPKKTPLKAPRFVGTLSARGRSWACESSSACTAELRTFYCERVRQMQLSRLNSGMLVGFLCKTEAVWIDFRRQVAELCSLDGRT
jgi:hypothetical protein